LESPVTGDGTDGSVGRLVSVGSVVSVVSVGTVVSVVSVGGG